ncbi:LysR family transcriptional regulator [Pseudaminobacter arsenicus]|uniref:LysR family transcriptional regulator n=1 Tax=Borborobacter arsenicus TaxID=1851146 RepID=A0A432UZC5_9HYPH|nr:LysR family transcriptional regulator [Pseudaminobacter arsenicus]RUM95241.1 LysR family transcriptional regulator [Pseudaminobacter arsenicus]
MLSLNYNHLRYFWAVAHDGNLTRTATRLNVTQSALSVQIRKLEASLGNALFERSGRQLRLTEAGQIALDHADAIFTTGEELLGTLRDAGPAHTTLRLGALATLSRNFQMEFLQPLLGRPGVELVLRSGNTAELLASLRSLSLDVVLINQPPVHDGHSSFVAHRLAERAVSLIGAPARFRRNCGLAERLMAHPVIVPTSGTSVRAGFDALIYQLDIRPHIIAEADDMAMMRLLAREDIGIAVLPPIVVKDEIAVGSLVEGDALPGIVQTFYAVMMERRFPNPLLKELMGKPSFAV